MGQSVYKIAKAPVGWVVFLDPTRTGGVYGTKEAALEAAAVTGTLDPERHAPHNVPGMMSRRRHGTGRMVAKAMGCPAQMNGEQPGPMGAVLH